jgi:hypothetical protein
MRDTSNKPPIQEYCGLDQWVLDNIAYGEPQIRFQLAAPVRLSSRVPADIPRSNRTTSFDDIGVAFGLLQHRQMRGVSPRADPGPAVGVSDSCRLGLKRLARVLEDLDVDLHKSLVLTYG